MTLSGTSGSGSGPEVVAAKARPSSRAIRLKYSAAIRLLADPCKQTKATLCVVFTGRPLIVSARSRLASSSRQWLDIQPIEAGDAVGLGPQGDLAFLRERLVGNGVELLAIERDRKAVSLGLETECVPFVCGDL